MSMSLLTVTEKASLSWSTPYETHSVASQKQLEGTRITRKGDSYPQVSTPPSKMVVGGRQLLQGKPLHPQIHALQSLQTHQKKGGARGTWSLPESKLHINYVELKVVFLALIEFQDLCSNKIVLVANNNTTVGSYINKEGGMRSGSLCPSLENPDLVFQIKVGVLRPVQQPGSYWDRSSELPLVGLEPTEVTAYD